ncbi:MAG: Asp-tRNA(Asn)/Glu-tRNA(Gln) amidotransferase subunit GatB [Chitinophagaceae bacterium]
MTDQGIYEIVVGLEVHAQLLTKSKLFCGDSVAFGAAPNTHVSPITLGHPGTLPKMNRKAIEFAVKMGLACHCQIERENYFARKNYFYPDLPKGYQVSQHTTPVCKGGFVTITTATGEKNIRLNRIHLEEDAGKSLHDVDEENTCIDYNRSGTALIEIVTEPDLCSGEEAFAYLTVIRKLVRYLGICDGNMEEGSLRCDANISVRKKGETRLGTRVEIKNLNSIRNVKRAIEVEAERLTGLLEKGERIRQETRSFDANKETTSATREKEEADDYRYFAEPDLTPFHLEDEFIESIRQSLPALQEERVKKYTAEWELSSYDAAVLTEDKTFADYFEELIACLTSPGGGEGMKLRYKAAANWMLGPVRSWLNEPGHEIVGFPVTTEQLAGLILLIDSGKINFSIASSKIFPQLLEESGKTAEQIATEQNLLQQSDLSVISGIIDKVLEKFAGKVTEYKKGKKGLLALFVGEVMKQSKGKADPKLTNELLLEKLK